MTELIVIRHGETDWNLEGRLQGHLDSKLTELGERQAAGVARRLAADKPDVLYSSDLVRAYRTAEHIAEATGLAIHTNERLRERRLGVFQGLTWDEIRERYPEELRLHRSRDPDYVVPEGESQRNKHDRQIACVNEIIDRHRHQRIAIVSHGGFLDSIIRHTLQIPLDHPRHYRLYNASINTILIQPDNTWMLSTWGDVHHLEGGATYGEY